MYVYVVQETSDLGWVFTHGVFSTRKEMYAFVKKLTGGSRRRRKDLILIKCEVDNPENKEYLQRRKV